MRGARTLRSGAFRFALLFAGVFALGSTLLLLVVDHGLAAYARDATVGSLQREAGILKGDDRSAGRAALIENVALDGRAGNDRPFHYLLVDPEGRRLAGALPMSAARRGLGTVTVTDAPSPGDQAADIEVMTTYGLALDDGALLVVGTDTYDIEELRSRLVMFTALGGLTVTFLALLGGYFVGGLFLRRLDEVNGAVDRIMAGDLAERLPAIGLAPEFDQLSGNLNVMLDRIGMLMDGLRQVSTDIAHDLRTPLTRLRQQLESLNGAQSLADYQAGIAVASAQTDEILAIFRALLRIGTIEGGQGHQRFGAIDLTEVMDRVALAYQPVAEDAGKLLTLVHAPDVAIIGDAELIAQMFTNLIENAIGHTPEGARITSALTVVDGHAVACIVDDGPGVPKAERQRILTRFYRLDPSRGGAGAGLGLALVAAIASLHSAELSIGDNAPGLTVSVRFPRRLA